MKTPPGLTCVNCKQHLYPAIARATDNGWTHANRCERACSVADCERKNHAHNYCQEHYRRYKAYGDALHEPPRFSAEERLEDVRWMAETGECMEGAASRLGMQVKALEAWLRRYDPACLARLIAHRPRDHNRTADGLSISELTGQRARRQRRRGVAA